MNTLLLRESFSDKLFYNTWQKHCTKLLWEGFSLKVSILKLENKSKCNKQNNFRIKLYKKGTKNIQLKLRIKPNNRW